MYTLFLSPDSNDVRELYANVNNTGENSGLDLYVVDACFVGKNTWSLDLGVRCEMLQQNSKNVAYLLMPRSSIYKLPIRMCNSIGLIDAGYRGTIKAMVDCTDNNAGEVISFIVSSKARLFQIVAPDFQPFAVKVLSQEEKLSESIRGANGFGSTGV